MAQVIDLTVSPRPEVIDISSDHGNASPGLRSRTQKNKKRKRKKGKSPSGLTPSASIGSSAQPSRAHSPEIANKHSELDESTPPSNLKSPSPSSAAGEPGLFIFDGTGAPIAVEDCSPSPKPTGSNLIDSKLLLPSHVAVFHDDVPVLPEVLAPPKLGSDDEDYIEYLDYEDRKAPGLVRYFEVEGDETGQLRPSISKCKNCGAEGDHKTYECPIQICLTCGAHNEHSTRSCPISKTCYTCGMKGHINKTCPNRFSARVASSDLRGDCGRCGSTEHKLNECPTLWRIYQYVNDEERAVITQSRKEKKQLAIGEGGEGYVGGEVWCYNCADTGHLGDDCDELPHPATSPTGHSAFGSHNIMSGPFYDPAAEPVSIKRGPRERADDVDWNASVPVDVGKQGKNKDRERLEKRFREQEDEGEDWFSDIRNTRRKGRDQQAPPTGPHGKSLKFGLFKDGGYELPSSPPTRPSLLARLGDSRGGRNRGKGDRGRDRQEPSRLFENSIRIRGAATDQRQQDGKYPNSRKTGRGRGQDGWDGDQPGHRGPERGPRYRGGYDK